MNRDQIKGKIEEIKGDIKKRIGGASEKPGTQAEGWMEEKKGQVRKGVGDLEEQSSERRRQDPDEDI